MKLICRNPEELIQDVKTIGFFGKGSIISRINLGKTEYEEYLANTIIKICRDKVEGKEKEADLTTILNVRAMGTMSVLKDVLTIEGFDKTSEGEDVVVVSYITYEKLKEKNNYNNMEDKTKNNSVLYAKMQEIYDKDRLIPYSDSEIEDIVKKVIDKYISDLNSRENITFGLEYFAKNHLYIGGGKRFIITPLEYFVNGERIRVCATIMSSAGANITPPQNQFPDEEGSLDIYVIRIAKNGEQELICRMEKDVYIEEGFGTSRECKIKEKKYRMTDKKTPSIPNLFSISEIVSGKKIENKIPSEETFREFASSLIIPEKIDALKDILWEKTRFIPVDKVKASNNEIVESSDWPENLKKQTIPFELNKSRESKDEVETLNQDPKYVHEIYDELNNIILRTIFNYYFRDSKVGVTIPILRLFYNSTSTSILYSIGNALERNDFTDEEHRVLKEIKELYDEGIEGAKIIEALIIIIRSIQYNDEEIVNKLKEYGMNIDLYQGIEVAISSYIYSKYQGVLVSKTQFYELLETSWGKILINELDRFLINEFKMMKESEESISRLEGAEAELYANKVSQLGLIPSKSMLTESEELEYPSIYPPASKKWIDN